MEKDSAPKKDVTLHPRATDFREKKAFFFLGGGGKRAFHPKKGCNAPKGCSKPEAYCSSPLGSPKYIKGKTREARLGWNQLLE